MTPEEHSVEDIHMLDVVSRVITSRLTNAEVLFMLGDHPGELEAYDLEWLASPATVDSEEDEDGDEIPSPGLRLAVRLLKAARVNL